MKVSGPEDSGRIVAHENMKFSNENYETRTLKLADKDAKCVAFERREIKYALRPLAARLPELASKLD